MNAHAIARPFGLALGIFTVSGCVVRSPLGEVDTDTDGGSGTAGTVGMTSTAGPTTAAESDTTGVDTSDTGIDPGPPPVGPAAIDILFVFDNSGSMGEEQAALAASIDSLVTALEQVPNISYHIGVTTTDNGNPWCGTTSPEAGKLQLSSCRGRTGEFIFNGNPPKDATQAACLDVCTLDEIPILPTATYFDPEPQTRPWIEGGAGGTNLDGVSVADALRCTLPQGVAGCGFESPLTSAKKAIMRAEKPGEASYGFLRPDAHLAIVFVTDETDCSYVDEFQTIFLGASMGGNPEAFWSDPMASAPTSAVCWRAGVECTGGPGVYDECHATNRDVDGNYDVADDLAVLEPVEGFREFFAERLAAKRALADASVFLFGVVGVPPGYPASPLQYFDAVDPSEQNDFGIGAGCTSEYGSAVPSLRERELIESFQYEGMATLYSICQPPLDGVYSSMVAQLAPYLGG